MYMLAMYYIMYKPDDISWTPHTKGVDDKKTGKKRPPSPTPKDCLGERG